MARSSGRTQEVAKEVGATVNAEPGDTKKEKVSGRGGVLGNAGPQRI